MPKQKRASRATWCTITLPSYFQYEDCGDHEAEQHVDYVTGDDHGGDSTDMMFELNHPEQLRLDKSVIADILFDCTDHAKVKETYCEWTTEAFDKYASEDLGFELQLTHSGEDEGLIKLSVAKRLMARMKRGGKVDEFCAIHMSERSWRSDRDARLLLDVPLDSWEADELGFLLRAALEAGVERNMHLTPFELSMRKAAGLPTTIWGPARTDQEMKDSVFQHVFNGDDDYQAWSNGVDWKKYEAKVEDARADLARDMDDEEWERLKVAPRRCPLTLELPLVA